MFVIDSLGPGGAERSLAEMLPGLIEAGLEPMVVCLSPADAVGQDIRRLGVEVRVVSGRGRIGRVRALRRQIAAVAPDCVHTTLFESDVAGRLAAAGRRVPVITSLVNAPYLPARLEDPNVRRSRLWAARMIDGWTARHLTTHFHAVTYAVKSRAVEALGIPPERVTVIERGRDPVRLGEAGPSRRRSSRAALGIDEDAEVLVTAGRQEFQKGHRFLLEAMAILANARPQAVLMMAGREGHASAELDGLRSRLRLGDRVRFLGQRTDVPDLLAAGDIFVFPSLYEGFGGAVIEAMALGLPVVASDLEALREVVEPDHSAILVPPGSPGELASAIGSLLDDPDRARALGERGRRIFEERFTVERAAGRMVDLYRRVLRDHRARPARVGA
jgi:glycosyltransferase involved in cell wall biosynthesis